MTSNWFRHGWKLKLISLGLAVGIWYYAVNEESVEIVRVIPLQVSIKNENMSILKVSTERLRVLLKVSRSMVSEVASSDIRAEHIFGRELNQAGEYSFHTDAREIQRPLGVHVLRIDPPLVQVLVDEMVTEKLPIKAQLMGDPAVGYKVRVDDIALDPNAVMVRGPKGEIEAMSAVPTAPIDLTGRTRTFRMITGFDLDGPVKPTSAKSVSVNVPIHEVSEEKKLENVVVKMIRSSGALGLAELSPQKITVSIQGPQRVLQNLTAEKMHAYADISGLDYGEHVIDVTWVLPPGVTFKDDKKMQVTAVIRPER